MKRRSTVRRIGRGLAIALGVLVAAAVALAFALRHPMPEGTPGTESDALARAVEEAVNVPAWKATGAVRWSFRGEGDHLWDRRRNVDRFRRGDRLVLVD